MAALEVNNRERLSQGEIQTLQECETIIGQSVRTAWGALCRIRNQRLYRATHPTFEDYCQDRWEISSSRARQIIGASEALVNAPESITTGNTLSERALRPVVSLEPEQQQKVFASAAATAAANDRPVEPADIRAAVAEIKKPDPETVQQWREAEARVNDFMDTLTPEQEAQRLAEIAAADQGIREAQDRARLMLEQSQSAGPFADDVPPLDIPCCPACAEGALCEGRCPECGYSDPDYCRGDESLDDPDAPRMITIEISEYDFLLLTALAVRRQGRTAAEFLSMVIQQKAEQAGIEIIDGKAVQVG